MTFTAALAGWERWEDQSMTGALVFCDWCQDRDVSDYWTDNWRQWLKFSGDPKWLGGELRRLRDCERALVLKGMKRSFPKRLLALREKANLSREQLADAASISRESVRLYELGERRPTWDAVQAIAKALGVPTDTFRDSG